MKENLFYRILMEAPEDEGNPPEISDDVGAIDDAPPDADNTATPVEAPPDIGGDDFGSNDMESDMDLGGNEEEKPSEDEPQGLDNKVSAVLNSGLYKKTLTLLSEITKKKETIKDNIDIIRTLDPDSVIIQEQLERLEDNIRDYNEHHFLSENYSKNLLFYTKCLNLYNQIVLQFSEKINKAIKDSGKS